MPVRRVDRGHSQRDGWLVRRRTRGSRQGLTITPEHDANSVGRRTAIIVAADPTPFNGRVAKFVDLLDRIGFDPHVVSLLTNNLERDGFTTGSRVGRSQRLLNVPLSGPALAYRQLQRRLIQHIGQRPAVPAWIVAMDPLALDATRKVSRKMGAKILFDGCEAFGETARESRVSSRYASRLLGRNASRIHALSVPSAEMSDFYRKHYGKMLPEAGIIPNAPVDHAAKPQPRNALIHKRLGWPRDRRILLYTGALHPGRGLEALAKSADDLPSKMGLVYLGYGTLAESLAASAGPRFAVLPAVSREELFTWMSQADYGLVPYPGGPTNHELSTPNKLYEFPAVGVPILAAPRPTLQEMITTHGIGWIVDEEPFAANSLRKTLSKVGPNEYKRAVDNCMTFRALHSADSMAKTLARLIDRNRVTSP